MIAHFSEVTDGMAYGKFMLARFDHAELSTTSAMPEANGALLLNYAGRRRMNRHATMVWDLQRGDGAAWPLEGGRSGMHSYYHQHLTGLWRLVCPMYLSFVQWLYDQRKWALGEGDITEVPRYLELHAVYEGRLD